MIRATLILTVLMLTGCGYESLYSQLDERQANEMLALLLSHGHDARKSYVDKSWSLEVGRDDLAPAMSLLNAEGWPRERYDSLGDVFAKQGLVSTPLEERARLLHALSQELAQTISSIDGVVNARVHLAIPEHTPMEATRSPSSASVFIKHRPGATVANKTASIKSLVVNSVEGLPYDNVSVIFFAASGVVLPAAPEPGIHTAGMLDIALPAPPRVVLAAAGTLLLVCCSILLYRRKSVGPRR